MKLEDNINQQSERQVGITLQRIGFTTVVDCVPAALNAFDESPIVCSGDSSLIMAELASPQTLDQLNKVARYQQAEGEEYIAIPLRRIDSGPHQHHLQESVRSNEAEEDQIQADQICHTLTHMDLLEQIDNPKEDTTNNTDAISKPAKRGSTLSRMLRGIRKDKNDDENDGESSDSVATNISLSKILQKVNPVGKNSREGISKVFHRIGDVLQRNNHPPQNEEVGLENMDKATKQKTLERIVKGKDCNKIGIKSSEQKGNTLKIGEKLFKHRPTNIENAERRHTVPDQRSRALSEGEIETKPH